MNSVTKRALFNMSLHIVDRPLINFEVVDLVEYTCMTRCHLSTRLGRDRENAIACNHYIKSALVKVCPKMLIAFSRHVITQHNDGIKL